jgi:hypothetical protein
MRNGRDKNAIVQIGNLKEGYGGLDVNGGLCDCTASKTVTYRLPA